MTRRETCWKKYRIKREIEFVGRELETNERVIRRSNGIHNILSFFQKVEESHDSESWNRKYWRFE